ncbi:hypothetical protein Patl1_05769 [Pistacia atlantica]|uniref:Uncharacterized protein n=1 Tax=Pistacia atlantica TaxID=434234 RepID=A0ACC1BW00_9ROSI|nr:hypothetical protein Patl1_05769 [Pistacia atlantica]
MASLLQLLPFICLHLLIVIASTSSNQTPKPYIVYMGSSSKTENGDVEDTELAHLQLLSTIIPSEESERISLIHHYKHAFKGFAAMLAEKEALALSGNSIKKSFAMKELFLSFPIRFFNCTQLVLGIS